MQTVTVHGAGAADSLSAGPSKGESGVEVVLDVKQSIKIHGRDLLEVDIVADVFGFVLGVLGIVFVDEEALHFGLFFGAQGRIVLHDVVGIEVALHGRGHTLEKDGSLVPGKRLFVSGGEPVQVDSSQRRPEKFNHQLYYRAIKNRNRKPSNQ